MRTMQRYQRLVVVGIVLGLLAFIAVTLFGDVSQLVKYAQAFPWWIMIPALALRVGNWGLRFIKWHYFLRLVGVRGLSIRDSAATFVSGLAMAASPGKVVEVLKAFIINNLTGAPVAAVIPVIAAERLSDGIAVLLLIIGAIAALAKPEYLSIALVSLVAIGVGMVVISIRPLCLRILAVLERMPLIGKFAHHFRAFYESSYTIVQPRNIVFGVATGLIGNLFDGLGVFLILIGLGHPASLETFLIALLAICFSVVTGSLSGSPGGIGASDLTITGVLLSYGFSRSEAVFATLLARFIQLWWGVLAGLAVTVIFRRRLFPASLQATLDRANNPEKDPANAQIAAA